MEALARNWNVMNIVKWIKEDEIVLYVEETAVLDVFREFSIKYYKHPKIGARVSDNYFYIRYESKVTYSSGPYQFPDNPELERVCEKLNDLGFVFWGTFKTEIAPQHFMENMQRKNKLKGSFLYIEAGEDVIKISECKYA